MTQAHPHDEQIRSLYIQFVDGWNRRSGAAVAATFADDGDIVGVDGTHHRGRLSIAADLRQVFGTTQTPGYVAVIRSVRPVAAGVAILMAHAATIPPGSSDLDPEQLAVHTMVAVDEGGGRWKISLFQATPAAWHGWPEAREELVAELRGVLVGS